MRIGIFGGTMNPIHHGHIHLIAHCMHDAELDRIFVMIAGDPYHKNALTVPAEQRYEWARLACEEYFPDGRVVVDDREVRRVGPTYTIDTVRELKSEFPDAQLVLLVGEDLPDTIASWKDSDELLATVDLYVVSRKIFPTSSSAIRDLASQKRPITGLVPVSIETDILQNGMYNEAR